MRVKSNLLNLSQLTKIKESLIFFKCSCSQIKIELSGSSQHSKTKDDLFGYNIAVDSYKIKWS